MKGNSATVWAFFCLLLPLFLLPWQARAATGPALCPDTLLAAIPERPDGSPGGSGFAEQAAQLDEAGREALIRDQLIAGNLPDFLRRLEPVTLSGSRPDGSVVEITICVEPDYLAVGSSDDYLRIPMGLASALAVARRFGFVLPTRKMVDAIYAQADAHLPPRPMTPGPEMVSTDYFVRHNWGIEAQCAVRGVHEGQLIAGHKKDLVLTNRLREKPGRVAIYGWHRGDGDPIQPLSTVHRAGYADYSHGVRLVSEVAYVNGRPVSLLQALADPELADILSYEGPIPRLASLTRRLSAAQTPAGHKGHS